MMFDFDENYWSERYKQGFTGWDIGYPSTPIVQYLDQLDRKDLSILIPGAGNAYEAAYAYNQGFIDTNILDISSVPLTKFKSNHPDFPKKNILHQDFFQHQGTYELILEQTFFCALNPERREAYCKKMNSLLAPSGKLVGVLFGIEFQRSGPPFGGSLEEYYSLFYDFFSIGKLEPCINSIPERRGTEIFIELMPKSLK